MRRTTTRWQRSLNEFSYKLQNKKTETGWYFICFPDDYAYGISMPQHLIRVMRQPGDLVSVDAIAIRCSHDIFDVVVNNLSVAF